MQSKKSLLITAIILLLVLTGALAIYMKLAPKSFDQNSSSSTQETSTDNQQAPDFEMESEEGLSLALSSLHGKPVIINCWATWCPYCIDEMPFFQTAYEKYGEQIEFVMLDMTDGQRETVKLAKEHISKNGYTFPVYYDTLGQCYQSYGVTALPTTIIVSADGTLIDIKKGALTEEALQRIIDEMLKG